MFRVLFKKNFVKFEKNKNVIHWPTASGGTQDLGHSFPNTDLPAGDICCSKIGCTSHIVGPQGLREGGGWVMVFTAEYYFLFVPISRIIFTVIFFFNE